MTAVARYRTERGAARYAAEIMRRFPNVEANAQVYEFEWGVRVWFPFNNKRAWAMKRPRNYNKDLAK